MAKVKGRATLFEISIDDKAAAAAIKRMRDNVQDYRKVAWPTVLPAVLEANERIFGSVPGPPLTAKYAKWKAAHGGGRLLELTGDLKRQVTQDGAGASGSGGGQKITKGKRALTLTTTWPTAHLHMKGTKGAKGGMPARQFLDTDHPVFQKAMTDTWGQVASKWARDFGRGG